MLIDQHIVAIMDESKPRSISETPTKAEVEFEYQENSPSSDAGDTAEKFALDANVIGNLFALALTVSAGGWTNIIPQTSIPFIAQRFPEGAGQSAWIATASLVVSAVVQCFVGDLAGVFGRRGFLFFGCACGIAGQLLGGLATSITMLIGGQVLNGLSVASMFLASPLIQEIVPKKHRAVAVACSTIVSTVSYIGGPIIQGVLIEKKIGGALDGWRVGFYIGAGYWAAAGVCLALLYHPQARLRAEGTSVIHRLCGLDWCGIFLVSLGITLFLVGLNYGDNPYPWTSARVLGCLIPGIALCIAFGLWEWKGTAHGILPHRLFGDRNYPLAICVRIVGGIALLGSQAYLPQIAVNVFGTGGLETSVWQLPLLISSALGSLLAAGLMRLFSSQLRWVLFGLMCAMILGGGLMLAIKPGISFAAWFFPSVIMGLPVGAEALLLTVLTGYFVPDDLIATGVCLANSATLLGGAVAVIIYSTVFNSKIRTRLPADISDATLEAGLPPSSLADFLTAWLTSGGNAAAVGTIPGTTPDVLAAAQEAAKTAYSESYHYIWYILLAFSAVCSVLALLFTSTEKHMTDEVTAPVQKREENGGDTV
ncbi:major facilitator superfamily domain-containing protein [Aspergillus pseudoustus]|uniref:Major facilitator superfamily domain-containing protein n=1 Tax=Aspergillus pseudoustus TaxID=1810923 RepID=A0ABR4JGX9_9EURO